MVCGRCIESVRRELEQAGVQVDEVSLGEVSFTQNEQSDLLDIEERLKKLGFSVLKDKRLQLVSDTRALIAKIYSGKFDFPRGFRFSTYASGELGVSYDTISAVFTEIEQTTIEKYILSFRTERIKEALVYTDSTLSDLAFDLGFSSVAHLSKQFKDQTGLTPTHFKEIRTEKKDLKNRYPDNKVK